MSKSNGNGTPVTGGQLPEFLTKENPARRDIASISKYVSDHAESDVLFRIDPKVRQEIVDRICRMALDDPKPRAVLAAARLVGNFERVNLANRVAGFGDGQSGVDSDGNRTVDLDQEFLEFARAQAIDFADGKHCSNSHSVKIATPITLGAFASAGKYQPARHLMYIDRRITHMIDCAERGEHGPRVLLVKAPPRHGKSEYCSTWLPTWFLGRFPDRQVMLASYSDAFSKKWSRAVRDNIATFGRGYFGIGVSPATKAAGEWGIEGRKGGMVASGAGGSFTGRGANLLLVDDPVKNAEEAISEVKRESVWNWFQSTALTRQEPGAVAVVVMTPWHQDDLIGRIESRFAELEVPIETVSLPAFAEQGDALGRAPGDPLWPERIPATALERLKKQFDSYWWRSMYQCQPGAYGQTGWPEEYFDDIYIEDGESWPENFVGSVTALDPSQGKDLKRSDYSAMVFIGLARGKIWVDCDIKRRDVSTICRDAIEFHARNPADRFGVEVNCFQELLKAPLDEAAKDAGVLPLPLASITNTTNKQLRIGRLGPWLARGKFRIRKSPSAKILVQQLRDVPFGTHDDGPDAMEMALRLLRWLLGDGEIEPEAPEEVLRV